MLRRASMVLVLVLAFAAFLAWRRRPPAAKVAPSPETPSPARAAEADPAPAPPRRAMSPPAIELQKPVAVRPRGGAVPGTLEGVVVDAETDEGIAGAELTFSHDDGAYSTASGPGGAFRFAPRATGTYRLVSADAKGYASFESEFGRSPVSFTSTAGQDITGVVLRLMPESKARRAHRAARRSDAETDAGDPADAGPPASGSLHGHVADGRTGAPVTAFAIALWRRNGIAVSGMIAPASFLDPAGAYEVSGLPPGTYEVAAMAAGYAASNYAIAQIASSPVVADFALRAGARIAGVVSDDLTKRPVAGAVISLEGRRGDAPDLPVAPLSPEAETGADGRFALEHVPPDAISLSARKRGYLARLVSLGPLPEDGDATPLAISLTPREPGDRSRVELTGIGAVLAARRDVLEIVEVVPNAGAADAGLVPGDEIVAIDGKAVTGLGYERAIGAIRGPEGTMVALRIRRGGGETNVLVTRKLVRQ